MFTILGAGEAIGNELVKELALVPRLFGWLAGIRHWFRQSPRIRHSNGYINSRLSNRCKDKFKGNSSSRPN
jgi:hypothetical protein